MSRDEKKEESDLELSERNLEKVVGHSFSYDGYEQLHDEAMDQISVSIQYSDYEAASTGTSRNDVKESCENQEKKMKISLSQEQLKLKSGNFLSVPVSGRKSRSASFSTADKRDENKSMKVNSQFARLIESKTTTAAAPAVPIEANVSQAATPPRIITFDENDDEVVYAVPRRVAKEENEIRTLRASSLPPSTKSVSVVQTSSAAEVNKNFKYPLSFYCKLCNNLLNDPRTLDCLHSFCMQCLSRLDASNDLQNNQFWRKISGNSDTSCEWLAVSNFLCRCVIR